MIIKLSSDKEMEAKCEYVDKNTQLKNEPFIN